MRSRWLLVGATAMLVLAGCNNNAAPTPEPELAFCESLDALAASVDELESTGADATVDEVRTGIEAVLTAAADVRENAGTLAEDQVAAIATAVDGLQDYRDSIADTQTVEQVVQGAAEHVAAIRLARIEAGTAQCGLEEAQAAASAAAERIDAAASQLAEVLASPAPASE